MNKLALILPAAALVSLIGGAIAYVRAQAPVAPAPVAEEAAPAATNLMPPSDRYGSAAGAP